MLLIKMSKRIRKSIDLQTKYDILIDVENKIVYKVIVDKYNLKNKSNISQIVSEKEKIKFAFESGLHKTDRKKLRNRNMKKQTPQSLSGSESREKLQSVLVDK